MKHFLRKVLLFLIPITLFLLSGLFLPPTPRASRSLLFADKQKDSLLENIEQPRIIFVGGSNLSFGLNSYLIRDSLNLNPVNTAIHAGLGVKYMLENTLQYVKKGDIIILALEYYHFYRPYESTSDELLRIIFDVSPDKWKLLSLKQAISLLQYVPKFTLTKFKPSEYVGFEDSDIYSVNSFNKFGDTDAHWNMKKGEYEPVPVEGKFNKKVIRKIRQFENEVEKKGGTVYITFPCLDEISYYKSREKVERVEKALRKNGFKLIGDAERYVMPPDLMFNTNYHLIKEGVDLRTLLFIEDFRKVRSGAVSENLVR